jgi:catechol 2,3-dioxygenase-like lactoylglutathione lyase family enzyme
VATEGIAGFYVETHDYAASRTFWQALGFTPVFETDHNSGQLAHPSGGPYVFLAERESGSTLATHPILAVAEPGGRPLDGLDVRQPYTPQHWNVVEAIVRDPDGRDVSLHAPLPAGVSAVDADAHHAEKYGSAE